VAPRSAVGSGPPGPLALAGPLALVGAGSLGQAFAGLLARSGQAVTLLATPATAERLRAAGCVRLAGAAEAQVPVAAAPAPPGTVGVTAAPAALPAGAGLLFTTKGHQLRAAAAAVRAAWPAAGDAAAWVGGVQNGLAKDDVLAAAFGPERLVGAVTILGAERRPDGPVFVTALGRTYLGELDGHPSARVASARLALEQAGIPAEAPADIRSVLWSKACNAAGVFGVSVLARVSGPRLFGDPDLLRAYLGLVRETAALAAAHGVVVGDYTNFPIRTYVSRPDEATVAALAGKGFLAPAPGTPEFFPSMTQDLLAGRALEVDDVFGDLVERADRAGVAVPRLRFVRDVLRGLDPGRHPR
jgi:2-dehydropantoate 2-reductase